MQPQATTLHARAAVLDGAADMSEVPPARRHVQGPREPNACKDIAQHQQTLHGKGKC